MLDHTPKAHGYSLFKVKGTLLLQLLVASCVLHGVSATSPPTIEGVLFQLQELEARVKTSEESHAAELIAVRTDFYEQLEDIRKCSGCMSPSPPPPSPSPPPPMPPPPSPSPPPPSSPPLGCKMGDGADYRGSTSATINGLQCQAWTSQTPHAHSRTPSNYPSSGLGDHNFCRNPDEEPGPWCYTMDPSKRWDLCSQIPECLSPIYTLMNDALSWGDANAACQAAGLQLATVQSAAQNALLLTAAAGNIVWIGGTDAASEGVWAWSPSNTPLSYTNWKVGEPNNSGNEDCLQFNYKIPGEWNDARCTNKFKYVCQPPHYTLMNDALSWGDADAACLAAGLQLATVQSAAQNALLLTAAAGNEVWIGGTDAASEGAWVWSSSNTPLSYTNWKAGEPNNSGGEDCLEFNYHTPGTWNDARCTATMKYVCQQPH